MHISKEGDPYLRTLLVQRAVRWVSRGITRQDEARLSRPKERQTRSASLRSSSARRAIPHEETGYIYADYSSPNFKPLAVRRGTIHVSVIAF